MQDKTESKSVSSSEYALRAIVNSTEDAIFCKDLDFRYTFVNPAFLRLLGIRESDALGKTAGQILGEEPAVSIQEIDKKVLHDKISIDVVRSLKLQGQEMLFHTMETPLCDESGEVIGLVGIVRDCTRNQAVEHALRECEASYRELSEMIPLGIVVHQNGTLLDGNARVFEMFGYDRDELIGQSFLEKAMAKECIPEIHKRIASGSLEPYEVIGVRKDGTRIPLEVHTANHVYKGKPSRVGVFVDISDRQATEHLLRLQRDFSLALSKVQAIEELWEFLLDHLMQIQDIDVAGLYLVEKETGAIDMVAHRGVTPEFVEKMNHFDKDSRRVLVAMKGVPIYFDRDGGDNPYREVKEKEGLGAVAVLPIAHEDKILAILVCSSRTLSEMSVNTRSTLELFTGLIDGVIIRIQAQEALRMSEQRLHQSDKMRAIGQLAGGIAHDFNNQLVGIMGFAEILMDYLEGNPELVKYTENILTSSKRAAELTSQLLAFARKGKYLSKTVDLHKAIHNVTGILKHSIDKRIEVVHQFNTKNPFVKGDPSQIENALLNLALNARDAMPDGGKLMFETATLHLDEACCANSGFDIEPGPYVRIAVKDNGVGIGEDVLPRIFEPFFTTKPQGKGAGMGLSATYGAVKNHKGAIAATSRVGKCTEVVIHLPSIRERSGSSPGEIASEMGGAHILLVDDEDIVREICDTLLQKLGYKVTVCTNGTEAVEKYAELRDRVDLVVLDMVMPDMTGTEVFHALQKMDPTVKVLLSSGFSIENHAQDLLNEGAGDFIQKPFRLAELDAKIKAVLNRGN